MFTFVRHQLLTEKRIKLAMYTSAREHVYREMYQVINAIIAITSQKFYMKSFENEFSLWTYPEILEL